jgi:hypothetical protein
MENHVNEFNRYGYISLLFTYRYAFYPYETFVYNIYIGLLRGVKKKIT